MHLALASFFQSQSLRENKWKIGIRLCLIKFFSKEVYKSALSKPEFNLNRQSVACWSDAMQLQSVRSKSFINIGIYPYRIYRAMTNCLTSCCHKSETEMSVSCLRFVALVNMISQFQFGRLWPKSNISRNFKKPAENMQ